MSSARRHASRSLARGPSFGGPVVAPPVDSPSDLASSTHHPQGPHIERLAWMILLISFAAFLLLVIGGPLAVRHYLETDMAVQTGTLEVIRSIVQVRTELVANGIAVTDHASITEGQTIVTDRESRAYLTLFDNSTVQIYPNTTLDVAVLRTPRFVPYGLSHQPDEVALTVVKGTVKVGVALARPGHTPPHFRVNSPHMQAELTEGGYFFDVTSDGTDVRADNNVARVVSTAGGVSVTLHRNDHTQVLAGQPPQRPAPYDVDLVTNGDFAMPVNAEWKVEISQGTDGGDVDPVWEVENLSDRHALHFHREGSETAPGRGNYADVRAVQVLNRNLPDPYTSLKLHAEVKLNYQSLSGGGYLSTEYPMILRVLYKDAYGSEHEWFHGFYYQNDTDNPTQRGELIRKGVWVPVEFELRESSSLPPFQIISVEARAAGWDFDSEISDIRLTIH